MKAPEESPETEDSLAVTLYDSACVREIVWSAGIRARERESSLRGGAASAPVERNRRGRAIHVCILSRSP